MSAPCEACPRKCNECAWDRSSAVSAMDPKHRLSVVRAAADYGCIKDDASIVVDMIERRPFMRVGNDLLPLSPEFGDIINGSRLEAGIRSALAAA